VIIVYLFRKNIDFSVVDNDKLLFAILLKVYYLIWLIDAPNQFQSDLVLKIYGKMCQKENAFFDNFHVGFQNK
jgi:hypothetical protein